MATRQDIDNDILNQMTDKKNKAIKALCEAQDIIYSHSNKALIYIISKELQKALDQLYAMNDIFRSIEE